MRAIPFPSIDGYIDSHRGSVIVQPRMGMSDLTAMRHGLAAVKHLPFPTLGTITLDSFTRTGQVDKAAEAVRTGQPLNGFPLLSYLPEQVRDLLGDLQTARFPIQVRHGTPLPLALFRALRPLGIGATEGGPISYCLPYGQVPLAHSLAEWAAGCELFAESTAPDCPPHLESFGGCMMGQLGPPSLLVAITVLEALFFEQHGLRSVSLSYAQGTSRAQDIGALLALRCLAKKYLRHRFHLVLYMYMGLFPRSPGGARRLIDGCATLARETGCERLIVKTAAEAQRIPTVAENLDALARASAAAQRPAALLPEAAAAHEAIIRTEATALIDCVLGLHSDLGTAIAAAFRRGLLDVPYCLHPDNRGAARTILDGDGVVHWADTGALPLPRRTALRSEPTLALGSASLLDALSFYRRGLDVTDPADAPLPEPDLGPIETAAPVRPAAGRRALLTTIPSDAHSWNLIFMTAFLREQGYQVVNLGVCVPVATTLAAGRREAPALVVVSTVNGHGYIEGIELAAAMRRDPLLAGTRLVLGGLIHSDPQLAEQHTARLRSAGFDQVYHGDAGLAAFRTLLTQELPPRPRERIADPAADTLPASA